MSESNKYHFPNYIAEAMNKDAVLSDHEMQEIENIYALSSSFKYPESNTVHNWSIISNQLNVSEPLKVVKKPVVLKTYFRWTVAAMLILSVSFGFWKYKFDKKVEEQFVYSSTDQTKKIKLSDGTLITLNNFSSLTANDFSNNERIVNLEGEAFFEVVHNDKPFTVITEKGKVNVMGTEFNVKNRKGSPFQVALKSGKVDFISSNGHYVLSPGEIITANEDNTFTKTNINIQTLGWMESKLIFENQTLAHIIKTLEDQYNVKFEYDKQLDTEKLTLTFNHLTAAQASELLSKTLNSKVSIK